MRDEKIMFELIMSAAKNDERVRAVYMNGSRTNPNVEKDIYQDFDVVFVVDKVAPFIDDKSWLEQFGEIAILQEPDLNDSKIDFVDEYADCRRYAWLMLFRDGNRIDLTAIEKEAAIDYFLSDKLTVLLLDKDKFLPEIPPPSDIDYHVKKPFQGEFSVSCNEFWWCLNNVAKGIRRDELPYAMEMFNCYVRPMLKKMLEWYIGTLTDFSVSAGKMGKFYRKFLPPEIYSQYAKTYSDSDYRNFWRAVFTACDLFHTVALAVADYCSFEYQQSEEDGTLAYLKEMAEIVD